MRVRVCVCVCVSVCVSVCVFERTRTDAQKVIEMVDSHMKYLHSIFANNIKMNINKIVPIYT